MSPPPPGYSQQHHIPTFAPYPAPFQPYAPRASCQTNHSCLPFNYPRTVNDVRCASVSPAPQVVNARDALPPKKQIKCKIRCKYKEKRHQTKTTKCATTSYYGLSNKKLRKQAKFWNRENGTPTPTPKVRSAPMTPLRQKICRLAIYYVYCQVLQSPLECQWEGKCGTISLIREALDMPTVSCCKI